MDFNLIRNSWEASGIFGKLVSTNGVEFATCEHAYQYGDAFLPKLPPGIYNCVRGKHELHSGPIETFEVLGVPGHKGILFHRGNFEKDSEGCILLGMSRAGEEVVESTKAFNRFLAILSAQDEFQLHVS